MATLHRFLAAGTALLILTACSQESGEDIVTPGADPADDAVASPVEPGSIEDSSPVQIDSLDELSAMAEDSGLVCDESEAAGSEAHQVSVCDGEVLIAYFSSVDRMGGYIERYAESGQDVIHGEDWFVTGRGEPMDALRRGLSVEP